MLTCWSRPSSAYSTAIDVNPNYITPRMLQFRLQKIMDEYVAGVATYYTTNAHMLEQAELGLLHRDRCQPQLHHSAHAAVPSAEDHGRVRSWRRHLLHD